MNSSESKPNKRRWTRFLVPRYSLRALFVLVTVICVYLGNHVNEVRKQKDAVAWVKEKGGSVKYENSHYDAATNKYIAEFGWEPEFLRKLLGVDFFYDVETVNLCGQEVSNISPLASLNNLVFLNLSFTQVRDISPLASSKNLIFLNLGSTQVSDISPLMLLTNLDIIHLAYTKVTKEEVEQLQQALPECRIYQDFDWQ